MMISKVDTTNTNISCKGKPVRKILEKGFYEGYFMEKSPLSKGYQAPTKIAKLCQNISNFFAKLFNN